MLPPGLSSRNRWQRPFGFADRVVLSDRALAFQRARADLGAYARGVHVAGWWTDWSTLGIGLQIALKALVELVVITAEKRWHHSVLTLEESFMFFAMSND